VTTNRVRVVVADDHEESLQVLANILRPEFEIVGTAINRDETAAAVGRLKPDVLVLGINMLLADGLHAARKFFKLLSHVHTIVLAVHADIEYEEAALGLGAAGFVLKSRAALDLPPAIRKAMLGPLLIS